MTRGHDESQDINNELKILTLHLSFTDDAGDFDLEVNHGISNSDFASFNFATSGFSPEKRWDAFTACFWFKVFMDTSAVYSLLAFYSNEELLFKLKYKEATGRLSFKGYANERYSKTHDFFGHYILGLNNHYLIIEARKTNLEISSISFSS